MVVGVPGTGIGGLFYLLAAACMPFRELWLLAHGRSSLARWKFIGMQWLVVAGMLVSLWASMWVFKRLASWTGLDRPTGLLTATPTGAQLVEETNVFLANAALGAFISLTAIMLIVQALRLVFPPRAPGFADAAAAAPSGVEALSQASA